MQLYLALRLLLAFLLSLAAAERERDIDIFAWPLSASQPQPLAKLTYTSTNASIKSVHPLPISSDNDEIVRVGFFHASGSWSGVATSASNCAPEKPKKLELHVRPDGEAYHVGFKLAEPVSQGSKKQQQQPSTNNVDGHGSLSVEVLRIRPGPVPHLNKPVVVSADGTTDQREPEKTFLQKYWWAIAGFLLLQVVLGGGGKE